MLDLVEGGSTREEAVRLGKAIEAAGATIINTGIGWHERGFPQSRPAYRVPLRLGDKVLKGEVSIPLIATNRINTPELPSACGGGFCDMVSMARPSWPPTSFARRRRTPGRINTCIACNQPALTIFRQARLLVNPARVPRNRVESQPPQHESGSRVGAGRPFELA